MKQKICLIRKKTDDILATFIEEFFKLVGFIIRDVIITEEVEEIEGTYDFILKIVSDSPSEGDILSTKKNNKSNNAAENNSIIIKRPGKITLDDSSNTCHLFLCDHILKHLFSEDTLEELKNISAIYTKANLFYFLYNKGNLKYVEEYYPIIGSYNNTTNNSRHEAFKKTLTVFQQCHDQLEDIIRQAPHSFHSIYMLLKLRYKINDISYLLGRGHIYRTTNMLDSLDVILKENPKFIRAYYLRAHICAADSQYLRVAALYYKQAIYRMHILYPEDVEESFLWYQLGRYFEKKRKDLKQAEACYSKAYEHDNKWYRILFKRALIMKSKHKEYEAIDLCNQIISLVLNGYQMEELTPKRQIYIFKSFRLLGDLFSKIERYNLAEKSYRNAIRMSEAGSNYYKDLYSSGNDCDCFNEVLSACMPKQPIYRKLVHCAMGMADDTGAEEYYLQMIKS